MIQLILNGDDFGISEKANSAILSLLEKGALTSTTAMTGRLGPAHMHQVEALKKIPGIGVGLHVEIDTPMTLQQQYDRFLHLFECKPTHLDLHKWLNNISIIDALNTFAESLNLPVRNMGRVANTKQTTFPVFFSSSFEEIAQFISTLLPSCSYEILFHPGDGKADHLLLLQQHLHSRPDIQLLHYGQL